MTMTTFMIQITKEISASYEVEIADTDDIGVAEELESEKLQLSEYEESLKPDWDFGTMPDIISVDLIPSDEDEAD
jgi:hypothetical protein